MERMISGIKPSGKLTLGNYIGAIQNFVKYQDEYELFIFIADLHALTTPIDKLELRRNVKDIAALYIACGLDPEKTTFFIQSDVLEHANLAWVLDCHAYIGELKRMTQFKDKSKNKNDAGINAGLFTYPALMAADILLYDPQYVPVGDDQKQHVELTRDIAVRMNNRYGNLFTVPEPIVAGNGARIMSLTNPTKKMSKSDNGDDKGCVYLLDDVNVAKKKILSAVTDSETSVRYDPENKPGVSNLIAIYSALTNKTHAEVEEEFAGRNYGEFKKQVADAVGKTLSAIQEKYREITASGAVERIYAEGAEKARKIAMKKLYKVYRKLGIK